MSSKTVFCKGKIKVVKDGHFKMIPVGIFGTGDQIKKMPDIRTGMYNKGSKFCGRFQQGIDGLLAVVPFGIDDLIRSPQVVLTHCFIVSGNPLDENPGRCGNAHYRRNFN